MKRRNAPSTSRNPAEVLEQRALLTTFTVNSLADTPDTTPGDGVALDANGEVSLRAALEEANAFAGADVIEFNDGSGPGVNFHDATPDTITLGGTQLEISSDITITGPGADLLTVSGNDASRVFDVTSGDVTLDSLTIADGNADVNGRGGGVRVNVDADVSIVNSSVFGNSTIGGRLIGFGAGVHNEGTLRLLSSTISENVVIYDSEVFGGGVSNFGTLSIVDSSISENAAPFGGGVYNIGTLDMVGTTVSGNSAVSAGGVANSDGTMSIVNSTISGNSADGFMGSTNVDVGVGGGVFNLGGGVDILSSTIAGNTAVASGGGLQVADGATISIRNSIVAGNLAPVDNDISGAIEVSSSNNLIGDAASAGGLSAGVSGNIVGVDWTTVLENDGEMPLLADNGGTTQSIALLPGSAAINAGDNTAASGLTTDPRGEPRLVGTVDIGAFEFQEAESLIVTTDLDVINDVDNLTSLREALAFANSDDDFSEITFGDGSSLAGGTSFIDATPDTITLGGTQLVISSDITISGPGADLLTVSGNNASRVFDVTEGVVVLTGLSVTDGRVGDSGSGIAGAGIRIQQPASVSIFDSSISENVVGGSGSQGGGRNGGGIWNAGILHVSNSLLASNTTRASGGAIWNSGVATVVNSTITGNVVRQLSSGGGILNSGTMDILNTTISDNFAAAGGGIRNIGTINLNNTIVAGNRARNDGPLKDIGGTVNGVNNLIGDAGSAGGLADGVDGNIVGVEWTTVLENDGSIPTLANNGGPTQTVALIPGSPAINSGSDTEAVGLATDQRGVGFDRIIGGTVDIGAFEAPVFNQPPVADAGGPYTVAEGSSVALDGSGSSDPDDDALTYEWDFDYDGTFVADATGVAPDFTGIDDGDVTFALRVSDGTESSEIVTTTVTVTNEDPAISGLTTDASTLESKSDDGVVTLSGLVTDAGVEDTHEVVVDWGDGTVETIVAAGDLVVEPDFSGTQHTYATGGIYTITVTVTDDDGGSVSETTSAVVQGVGLVDGVLYIIGTNGDDSVTLKERHQGTQLKVRTKFDGGPTENSYFDIADINSIEMHLCDGDDYASLTQGFWWFKHSVDIPATINGGDGNDVLIGGSANDVIDGGAGDDCLHGESGDDTIHGGDGHDWIDGGRGDDIVYAGAGNDYVWGGFGDDILLGQSGNDRLFGGWGRDIIIAGEGADRLYGQGQDDILITGDTNWDDDEDALKTMRDVWTGSGSASSRAQAIQDSGLEVMHDDDVDKVWGGWGCDWLLLDGDLDRRYW